MKIILCLVAILDFTSSTNILDYDTVEMANNGKSFEYLTTWEKEIAALPFQYLDRVLVCLNDEANRQMRVGNAYADLRPDILTEFPKLNIEYHTVPSCQKEIKNDDENPQTKTILSVIAPEPFWNNSEDFFSEIPMYFYDTLSGERNDPFPNGLVPHQRQWHLLKHAFIHYIKAHEWTRIAIVSDNSPNSQEFEPELVEEFERNKLLFNVQRCVGERCDFYRALKFLKDHSAVIIVANVEGRHAWNLMQTAKKSDLDMTSSQYLWLVREPFNDSQALKFLKDHSAVIIVANVEGRHAWNLMQTAKKSDLDMTSSQYLWLVREPFNDSQVSRNVVSITLSPTPAPNYPVHFNKTSHLNSIWRGLDLISTAVDSVKEKERIDKYYRSIFKKMDATYSHDKATAFIRSRSSDFIQMLFIEGFSIKRSYQKGFDAPTRMDDLGEYCLLRNDSFTSPCSDNWAVLICIVWLMFILIVFLLVYFFNRCLVWT